MEPMEILEPGYGSEAVDYERAWQMQREVHEQVVAGGSGATVILLEHPAVYTAGRRTEDSERPLDGTPVIDVDRGGKITWHGPGQLVGYPIVKLAEPMDVVAYVRRVEGLLIDVCAEFGVRAQRVEGRSGAWLPAEGHRPERKIAAIGIRVAQGVTMHGFSLNCDPDLNAGFGQIVPCGIADAGVTSLSAELGRDVTVAEVVPVVRRALLAADLTGASRDLTAMARDLPSLSHERPGATDDRPSAPNERPSATDERPSVTADRPGATPGRTSVTHDLAAAIRP